MRAKSMVLILIALGCGLVASIAISQVIERGGGSGNAALETVQIYVASTDIDVNDQLGASNVRVEDWPKSKVPEGAILDFTKIEEQFARVRFYEGEPILAAKLVNEIEGPAIKIPEGFRVCSLKVQMDTAVSGLVNPGDRVDIFGYFRKGQDVPRTGTRELLRNVRVFAINSETEQETDQDGRAIVAKTVSVLVAQDQVARLMLATELGTLRLALRRPNELVESTEGESATIESLFGSRSESADEDNPSGGLKDAAAAGGFAQFMANLNKMNGNQGSNSMPQGGAALSQNSGPAWAMEILTPQGGTQFTWNDVNRLPEPGVGAARNSSGSMPLPNATMPGSGFPGGLSPSGSDTGVADPQQNQEQEENNHGTVDD